ncbi:MAG: hypothetical protein A2W98_04960 [Bacteroidetes bacterium GWF2_33_38]|nr:MAG: hypothetical protein A2W98_04960 [Bacteroidetes bacterium GWF2_33_38]OFY75642.1 MAG: hypothetical protein A2265_00070 [Bacteroidetes bacterium RIFOXYA12_FULL_33_9]OFY90644.1 MAG: hypothetical protein A2236_02620 [Bacteroidetes bacterium RIFOXYA2_FULL_33_7]
MKKLLILAYDFPPYISVGGLRPYSWYKYLKEYNIYPIVVTRQWGNTYGNHLDYIVPSESSKTIFEKTEQGELIKTPFFPNLANRLMIKYGESKYRTLRKIISAFYEFFQWFFLIGPKSQIYLEAKKYLKTNKVDAIIATGDPFILFRYANILSKKHNIPWIADYRDLWSQDIQMQNKLIFKSLNQYLEKRVVNKALVVTTVSDTLKNHISSIISNKNIQITTNGFDPEIVESTKEIKQTNKNLCIAFIGTIYNYHPIESFLNVCSGLKSENSNRRLLINFYGVKSNTNITDIIESKYKNILTDINIYPKMANNILVKEIAKNNLFLLFNDYSYLGTKIFDYLAINRMILFCYNNDADAILLKNKFYKHFPYDSECEYLQKDVLEQTNGGIIIENSKHLKNTLNELLNEFEMNGYIQCNSQNVEQFSRKIQTQKLAEIIKKIT